MKVTESKFPPWMLPSIPVKRSTECLPNGIGGGKSFVRCSRFDTKKECNAFDKIANNRFHCQLTDLAGTRRLCLVIFNNYISKVSQMCSFTHSVRARRTRSDPLRMSESTHVHRHRISQWKIYKEWTEIQNRMNANATTVVFQTSSIRRILDFRNEPRKKKPVYF